MPIIIIHMQDRNFASGTYYSKNNFVCEEIIPTHLLFSCIVIFAFFMQSIILTSIQKGIEVEFLDIFDFSLLPGNS